MEIPGYEPTYFNDVDDELKARFEENKQAFEEKRAAGIARNEAMRNSTKNANERSQFISHCIKLQELTNKPEAIE
jgi:hypothetical protein